MVSAQCLTFLSISTETSVNRKRGTPTRTTRLQLWLDDSLTQQMVNSRTMHLAVNIQCHFDLTIIGLNHMGNIISSVLIDLEKNLREAEQKSEPSVFSNGFGVSTLYLGRSESLS